MQVHYTMVTPLSGRASRTMVKLWDLIAGPVPPPQIRFNVDPLLLSVELVCEVSADEVDSIEWKKDGAALPDSPLYQIKDRSQLYIGNVEKSDCATFSCNASNQLYWNESSSPLTFEGIPPVMWVALWLSAAALGVAIYCLLCFVVQFLQTKERKWITGRLWRIWTVQVQALVCIASLLLLVATIIWMTDRGASGTFILLSQLLLFVMAVTALTAVILACYPDKLAFFKSKRVCKVIIDSAAPGGVLLIVLFSSFLIQDIHTLRGEGCPPAIYQKAISIVLPFVLLFLLLLCPCTCWWFHRRRDLGREAEAGMCPQGADPEAQSEQQMQVLVQGVVAENPSRHIEDEAEETGAGNLGD
ncbi:uncharacterized protein [Ambystoma mexicanum]|uniref:uncharacterized protein isoform X2 n=1 Tax=Ambystoma mexicanum TaxID=8296 RepID=UPI0037E7E288